MIPATELARRLCAETHPFVGQTGSPVPCGQHSLQADRLWGLIGEQGTKAFEVVERARIETGTSPDLRALIREGIEAFRLTREYVSGEVLPAEPGWEWFDWTVRARRLLGEPEQPEVHALIATGWRVTPGGLEFRMEDPLAAKRVET